MMLVVGATGLVGGEICRRAMARGMQVRAMVRPTTVPAKADALRQEGAQIVVGDLRDATSLANACAGMDTVVSTVSAMPVSYAPGTNDIATTDLDGMRTLIDAARAAGVARFVYTSFSRNLDLDFPLSRAKRAIESYLIGSGLDYTILRPSFFDEVWLGPATGFDPVNGKAVIYGTGEHPISWISADDVAEFAISSTDSLAARNATLELGGPEALSPLDAVRIFERVGGRPIEVTHVSDEDLAAQETAATDPMARSFAGLMRCYAKGDPIDMTRVLGWIPVPLTSVEDYAGAVFGKVTTASLA